MRSTGHVIGTWGGFEAKGSTYVYNKAAQVTAGSSSIFTVANLNNQVHFQGLQEYVGNQFTLKMPRHWYDQADLFQQLIQAHPSDKPWTTEAILFSREWQENLTQPEFLDLYAFLLKYLADDTLPLREQISFDDILAQGLYGAKLSLETHLEKTLNYCYYITCSNRMGLSVAVNNTLAPISQLEQILLNHYRVKSAPIFVQLSHIKNTLQPHYYVLGYPHVLETQRAEFRKEKTFFKDLDVLSRAQRHLHQYLLDDYFKTYNPLLHERLENTHMHCFHHAPHDHSIILPSHQLIHYDPAWEQKQKQLGLPINWKHYFFRGLIQVNVDKD